MSKVFASIVTIGDELLIGQVVDTNSAWIAQELNAIGIWVRQRTSVGDVAADIKHALSEAAAQSSVVLITGGLGPTADDITKPTLCEYFGGRLVVDEGALKNVKDIFARLNRPLIERNLKQAEVPDVCTVIPNKRGTAPGMWFEKDGVVYVSMPGVPHEMKGMVTDYVLPRLQQQRSLPAVLHRTLLTAGVGESFLADLIQPWEEQLPPAIKLAYLPNYGMVRLRLTATGADAAGTQAILNEQFEALKQLVAPHLVTDRDEPLEKAVGRWLQQHGRSLGTAESCTGGYISHLITSHAGSSAHFKGSVVSYDNQVKTDLLGVSADTLAASGAVSEAVVTAMLEGACRQLGVDYAIAVSGIMGPDGGNDEKPVGTVWIAAGRPGHLQTQRMHFRFDRRRNIELTATYALYLLLQVLKADEARA
ncbi:MAG: CinA family nicotinamide mononucleotide deamidase-related protein [Chitinophagaceae bacterium]|nr:CinA family nicotinamide mononucleotide deamidase-related protein [Chitinophagaceae bacterium]